MQRSLIACLLLVPPLLAGCVGLGWRFGPGLSMRERRDLFAKSPVVEHRREAYVLTWTQGDNPFFFEPSYHAMGDRLIFALAATASSGSLAGRRREMTISGADNLEALRRGGAFWWEPAPEPRGSLVQIEIVEAVRP